MLSKHHGSQQKAPEHRVQRTMSQHTKCIRRNVQQFTRSRSSERMRTAIHETSEEVQIDVTMAEEYCYVETRHSEEICISPVEFSRDVHVLPVAQVQGRSTFTRDEGHQPRSRVMGRRQMRELKAIQNQSRWESESVDSGHCSEFSSRSSLSSAASTHSGCSRDSSFSEDEVFVSGDEATNSNTTVGVSNMAEYASVIDTPVKKLDNTYASIHTICDTPPVVTPPELPPRNRAVCKVNKSLGFADDQGTSASKMQSGTSSEDVIVKSKYHKYTVDDIVDSYMSLVNDIPVQPSDLRRCHSDNLQSRHPVQESPLRRSKSAQHFAPCPQTVTKATSSFAVKYNVSLDCNEIFF